MDEQKPVPLDYRTPAQSEAPRPSQTAPARPVKSRGNLSPSQATAAVIQTLDRADMAFVTRALEQKGIEYCIAEKPDGTGAYKKPLVLLVRPEDAAAAIQLAGTVIARRQRTKKLNEHQLDQFDMTNKIEMPAPDSGGLPW